MELVKKSFPGKSQNTPARKILYTLILLSLFRFGTTIPLAGIDQEALKRSFLQMENRNSILQILNMYSSTSGNTLLSPFSLGIIPYINASILVDLLTALIPSLEKLQSEEGEAGRRKLAFYKKLLSFLFAAVQSGFLIFYLKAYFYETNLFPLIVTGAELVTGSMIIIWITNLIESKGIGNGTSIIIFTNIVTTLLSKNIFQGIQTDPLALLEVAILTVFIGLICLSQIARMNIQVVSARQLAFLEKNKKTKKEMDLETTFQLRESGLSIRLNQAGIFPIIIASNLLPFFSILTGSLNLGESGKWINSLFYYLAIIGFNYFYTLVFWDPEKISEQLRKASVSIVNVTPGKATISYLNNVVRSTSLFGGIFLCFILLFYDFAKQILNAYLLNQINISSLIIAVGVAYELQKTVRALFNSILSVKE